MLQGAFPISRTGRVKDQSSRPFATTITARSSASTSARSASSFQTRPYVPSRRPRRRVARCRDGRRGVISWAAPDCCCHGASQKSAGARTASSPRRATVAGAPPLGSGSERRGDMARARPRPPRRSASARAARLDDRSNRPCPRRRAVAPAQQQPEWRARPAIRRLRSWQSARAGQPARVIASSPYVERNIWRPMVRRELCCADGGSGSLTAVGRAVAVVGVERAQHILAGLIESCLLVNRREGGGAHVRVGAGACAGDRAVGGVR